MLDGLMLGPLPDIARGTSIRLVETRLAEELWRDFASLGPGAYDALLAFHHSLEHDLGPPAKPEEPVGRAVSMPDEPTAEDSLGRDGLADALAAMMAAPDQGTPFTLALLGDWGSGKSSVIEMLKYRLRLSPDLPFDFATFNAWQYEQADNTAAGLAQEVVRGLLRGVGGRSAFYRLLFSRAWRGYRWSFVLAIAGLVAAAIGLSNLLTGAVLPRSVFGVGLVAFLAMVWRGAKALLAHPLAAKINSYVKLPSYSQHLGLIPVLYRDVESLCALRLGDEGELRRLVVFVDDLDRCHPECIVRTLDAVRLVMNVPGVIVVIAIDCRIAFTAVGEHYKELANAKRCRADIARDYLGKILQLPLHLPEPSPDEVKAFVVDRLFPDVVPSPADAPADEVPPVEPQEEGEDFEVVARIVDVADLPRPPATDVDLAAEMQDTEEQRDRFAERAGLFGFTNPRLLVRLRNAFRLLKLLAAQRGARDPNDTIGWEDILDVLFWEEFICGLAASKREDYQNALDRTEVPEPENDDEVGRQIGKLVAGVDLSPRDGERYAKVKKLVTLLVLPIGEPEPESSAAGGAGGQD